MDEVVSLRGRELEPRVVGLLAAAQIHRPPRQRTARAPAIAYAYHTAPERDLWGYERDRTLLGIAGVELRGSTLWLADLAVAVEARRTGIGRALIAFLRATYRDTTIEGDTTAEAAPFYAACGFTLREEGHLPSGEPVLRFSLPADRPLAP